MAAPRRMTSTERASLLLLAAVLAVTVAVIALRRPAVEEAPAPPATADSVITAHPAQRPVRSRRDSAKRKPRNSPGATPRPQAPPRQAPLDDVKNH